MNRNYKSGTSDSVEYFIGQEVEHSPAYGMKTLFVVGIQDPDEIVKIARFNQCEHVYLGANMSFNVTDNVADQWEPWEKMAVEILDNKFWVTLDVETRHLEGLGDSGLCSYNRFIPMISVKVPYIDTLNYNACIKIDDRDFDSTNPGVWVHHVHDLKSRDVFTDWSKYSKDDIIS